MYTFFRTYVDTCAAADTFRRNGDFFGRKVDRTNVFAFHAVNTVVRFPMYLNQAETIEPAINCTQWTEILAEWAVDLDRQQDDHDQDCEFPEEQSSGLTAEHFVGRQKRQCTEKGTGRTEVFAKCRNLCKAGK